MHTVTQGVVPTGNSSMLHYNASTLRNSIVYETAEPAASTGLKMWDGKHMTEPLRGCGGGVKLQTWPTLYPSEKKLTRSAPIPGTSSGKQTPFGKKWQNCFSRGHSAVVIANVCLFVVIWFRSLFLERFWLKISRLCHWQILYEAI